MAKYPIGIIYIQRDKFQLYAPNLPSILEFRFLPDFIRDLDIVNKELLFNLLDLFMKNNNIPPTSFIIIIADSASIIKDFLTPSQTTQTPQTPPQEIDDFIEHIPFEEVASRVISITNGMRAYATNKNLYETIKSFLVRTNSEVISILPGTVIGPELRPSLDPNAINSIIKIYPTLKEYNLETDPVQKILTENKPNHEEKKQEETETFLETENPNTEANDKKSEKKLTLILVGVFVFLLIILVIVYLNQPPF